MTLTFEMLKFKNEEFEIDIGPSIFINFIYYSIKGYINFLFISWIVSKFREIIASL